MIQSFQVGSSGSASRRPGIFLHDMLRRYTGRCKLRNPDHDHLAGPVPSYKHKDESHESFLRRRGCATSHTGSIVSDLRSTYSWDCKSVVRNHWAWAAGESDWSAVGVRRVGHGFHALSLDSTGNWVMLFAELIPRAVEHLQWPGGGYGGDTA